jgi:hypothetical protein
VQVRNGKEPVKARGARQRSRFFEKSGAKNFITLAPGFLDAPGPE